MKHGLDALRMGGLGALILLGCVQQGGGPAQDAAIASGKPMLDVTKLVNRSPDQVAAVLGKAIHVFKIKDDFSLMPGDDRIYKPSITGKEVAVRFHRKKAVYFDIDLPKSVKDPKDALKLVGLKPTSDPYIVAPTATRWRDEMNGFVWKDVSVVTSNGADAAQSGYDKILVTLAQPEE